MFLFSYNFKFFYFIYWCVRNWTYSFYSLEVPALLESFNAAKDSVDNAIFGICNAITCVHQTPVKVDFTDESKSYLETTHQKLLSNENELINNHKTAIGKSIQTLETKFKNVVNGFKGVWVDKKTFNIYYWLFIGIIELALCSTILVICYVAKFGML